MKVLFEVPLESSEYQSSQFEWLSDSSNRLFLIEGGKRLRTISIGTDPGKVLESANLADGRVCTNFSWNKDGNQLALVVDKRLIYFWDVRDNNLLHYKPLAKTTGESSSATSKNRARDVEHIIWSQTTNKVVIGYSTGQMLLCSRESGLSETFVDNSAGVLREISSLESSPHLDVFACCTAIFELLVMTFDGDAIFYNQGGDHGISIMKFSPPFMSRASPRSAGVEQSKPDSHSFWLAHSSQDNQIYFKMIELNERQPAGVSQSDNILHRLEGADERVIYCAWVDSSNLIVCSRSGTISLVQIKNCPTVDKSRACFSLSTIKLLEIQTKELSVTDSSIEKLDHEFFKAFELIGHKDTDQPTSDSDVFEGKSFSFSAMTKYRLFYFELIETDNEASRYAFEKIDDLDLTGSLKRIGLGLERLQWSFDSSMLSVQLTNGHILIYQTRLRDHMVTSYGSQTAYLSDSNEVTILNYGLSDGDPTDAEKLGDSTSNRGHANVEKDAADSLEPMSKASVIKVDLKPSVIAIGPKHLAIGLNNLVRFYSTNSGEFKFQEEYHSIVVSICLCMRFISVQFDDGRVKLHPLRGIKTTTTEESTGEDDSFLNERYFPDPTRAERISAFTLTDRLFIYCTSSFNLYLFCLKRWAQIQSFNYQKSTEAQAIVRLMPDGQGNRYLCLAEVSPLSRCRVFLYDNYRNEMISFLKQNRLYEKIFTSQLELVPTLRQTKIKTIPVRDHLNRRHLISELSRVSSAIWDTDGRTVLLMERKSYHMFVILDHTLESEGPIIEWVATIGKQSTYATLYASHGVVSFQTSLGRVINSIAESHDDEIKLAALSQQIQSIMARISDETDEGLEEAQAEIMRLKLEYMQMIVLIYPLSKCAEICEYIMGDSQFNFAEELRIPEIDDVLWRELAARAVFTSNLRFALLVYKRRRLQVFARGLTEIMQDLSQFGCDSKISVTTRLLILLGCDQDDD